MIATLTAAVLAVGGSMELALLAKATLAMAIGLVSLRIFKDTRASRRYLILASTFGVLGLLPAVAAFAPPLAIPVRERMVSTAPAGRELPAIVSPQREDVPAPGAAAAAAPVRMRTPSMAMLLTGGWAIGLLISLMPIAFALHRTRELRRTSTRWPDGQARVDALARAAGLRRVVTLGLHGRAPAPMTFGLMRPAILLPADATTWIEGDVDCALRHELEHVRRADWPAHLFARTVCAAYWFHPLVWKSWRHLHLEADRACDDAVVTSGDGSAFADQLVTLAARLSPGYPRTILAMASRGDLSARVLALLNAHQVRGRAGVRSAWAAALVTLIAGAVLSPLRAVERQGSPAPDAQALAFQNERFEVVALEPSRSDPMRTSGSISVYGQNNAVWAMNVTIEELLRFAYGIGPSSPVASARPKPWASIVGLPDLPDRYELRAHTSVPLPAPADGKLGAIHLMVQTLLADRFKLLTHWEPRSRPIYSLRLAGDRLGPQMRRSRTDCKTRTAAARRVNLGSAQPPDLPPSERRCGSAASTRRNQTEIVAGALPIERFVATLQSELGREIVNRTGLEGSFDIELRYTLDPGILEERMVRQWGAHWQRDARLREPPPPAPAPEWPSLDDALRDQLGLRLEPETALGEVLAIDRVERPAVD